MRQGWRGPGLPRQTFSASQLPVIMVTAKTQSEDIVEALKAGANDYVTKPVDLSINTSLYNALADLEPNKA